MDFNSFKQYVIKAAQDLGITEYELYYQTSESTDVDIFKHEVNEFSSSMDGGVCFRCLVNGRMGYASTEELSAEQAESLVKRAYENASVLENDDREFLVEDGQEYEPLNITPYELPTTESLIQTALAGQEALYAADPAVIDGTSCSAGSVKRTIAIFNSKGLDLSYENNIAIFAAEAVVSNGKEMSNDYSVKTGSFLELDVKEQAAKAVSGALAKLDAEVAPTDSYPVVFSPKAVASLLGTYSGIFSAQNAQKGLSMLKGKEGEMIAAPIVTLVDDPFYPDSAMPIPFDAEGSPAHKKNVIENGRLNTLLYNLKTAAIAGRQTTGNASKISYTSAVCIRPFTMYLAGGEFTEDELLQKAGNGVYINFLGGLHAGANVISGDFSLQSAGFLIENGVKTKAVKSFTVAGNFYQLLNQITAIGKDVELPNARGITSFGAPSILVEGLSIAGK